MPPACHLPSGCNEACPAYPHRSFTMEESLQQKFTWLKSRLSPFSEVLETVRSVPVKQRLQYRDKVCLHAEYKDNHWKIGTRKRGEVISIPDCPVHRPSINLLVQNLLEHLPEYDKLPLIYYVHSGSQLAFVLKTASIPESDTLASLIELMKQHTVIEGFWLHLHPSAGRKVFGKGGWHLVKGKPYSVDESGLRYGPAAFQQLLPQLYHQSLIEAEQFLLPGEDSMIIDLYSGTGSSICRWVAKKAVCIGVEISGDAIQQSIHNVPEVIVLRGTGKQRIPQLQQFTDQNIARVNHKLLYANPPRTGLETEVTEWIISGYRPEKIAYLSCSAGTLHRDLSLLSQSGYTIKRLIPFDFFPQTRHVEVLSLLELN